jgi:VanZ family protein
MQIEIKIKAILKYWLPVFLYAGFIFYMSSIPNLTIPLPFPYIDKLVHIAEYAVFGWMLARALSYSFNRLTVIKLYLSVVLIGLSYGILDEFHQSFVVGRVCSLTDAIADLIGVALGTFLFL